MKINFLYYYYWLFVTPEVRNKKSKAEVWWLCWSVCRVEQGPQRLRTLLWLYKLYIPGEYVNCNKTLLPGASWEIISISGYTHIERRGAGISGQTVTFLMEIFMEFPKLCSSLRWDTYELSHFRLTFPVPRFLSLKQTIGPRWKGIELRYMVQQGLWVNQHFGYWWPGATVARGLIDMKPAEYFAVEFRGA